MSEKLFEISVIEPDKNGFGGRIKVKVLQPLWYFGYYVEKWPELSTISEKDLLKYRKEHALNAFLELMRDELIIALGLDLKASGRV